ncbi:pathogenicity determinant protein PdpA1 [Francisella opportunistica]|uniref:pathogenicity determinant protein PdpA1 n=1 Tax=Francisella opportunistica TaxID=2016517 RepID=UPI000E0C1B92|nr:pathogenicity determinant protein PdpA1 [Francisella opportunistica]AXH32813.1 pathogenicity determinant protein PdpA1 [Francisella opportunistica]
MKRLANISELNIHNLVYELADEIRAGESTQSLAEIAAQVNDYLISTNHTNFKLLTTQLSNVKALCKDSVLTELDYKKYQKFYKIAQLKQNIDDYISYFSTNYKDNIKLTVALNQIKKSCSTQTILELSSGYIKKIDILMNILNNAIQRSPELDKRILKQFNKLENTLAKTIAYNGLLQKQELTINIKPIDSDFKLQDLNFVSSKNKQSFKEKSLKLNNLHIECLEIQNYMYGLEGKLTFQLAYINNHKDFDFLLIPNQPLLIDIQINDTFNFFKKESKKDQHRRSTRFVAIAFTPNQINIKEDYQYSIYSYSKNVSSGIKEFSLNFYDPLKALWMKHKPSYVDINKSLDDIIKDNFFFDSLLTLDNNKSNSLKSRMPQVFISTINRSFYDFFIEQLQLNKCFLNYFCDKKTGKVTYYAVDEIDASLQKNIANSDENLKTKLSPYDISCLKKQTLVSKKPQFYIKENNINPDIVTSSSRKEEKSISDAGVKAFSKIYQDNIQSISYYSQNADNNKEVELPQLELELISKNTLPFIDNDISLAKLENDGSYLLGSSDTNGFFIARKTLSFKRTKYTTKELYRNVSNFHYQSDSESDIYEKIAYNKYPNLTHKNTIKYIIKDYKQLNPEYPTHIKFNSFYITGKITIGENVNKDSKKAYKFFKNYKPEESSFAEFQESGEKGSTLILNSKVGLLYAIEIAKEMLYPNSSEKPIIYLPSKININSANNQFMPLRNHDIIMIEVQSISEGEIIELISNSAISTEKAQKELLQRQLLGAKENCEIAYSQTSDGETFSLTQLNSANENSFLINNKKGIFLRYKSKGN